MLKDIKLAPNFDMNTLVRRTDGLSGSDLKEACRNAAMVPVREHMRAHQSAIDGSVDLEAIKKGNFEIRPLRLSDFLQSDNAGNGGSGEYEALD